MASDRSNVGRTLARAIVGRVDLSYGAFNWGLGGEKTMEIP